jgi:transposase
MAHKKGRERSEQMLMPPSLDDYVAKDNPVRLIDAFVDKLDLYAMGFKRVFPRSEGRPPYDPSDLLKLFIYGYMNRVASSRRLERQAECNIEVKWLIGDLVPDFKTIARFRAENAVSLQKVFGIFVELGVRHEFFGRVLAAVDGSRFKGVNSIDKVYTKEKIKKAVERTKEKIREYIKQLEEADKEEEDPEQFTEEELQEKIRAMEEDLKKLQQANKKLEETGESQIAMTDPDSRLMKIGSKVNVGYNIQLAVESERKLIVAFRVTNDRSDANNLFEMSRIASEAVENPNLTVMADRGYYDFDEIKKCHEAGITTYIPEPFDKSNSKLFAKKRFKYDPVMDQYECPAGQQLSFLRKVNKDRERVLHAYGTKACQSCSIKNKCTTSKAGRLVQRHPNEHLVEAMAQRVKKRPRLMRSRKAVIEHVFGCLKAGMNLREFLTKGFKNVTAEFSLAALAFNLKRLINEFGTEKLIAQLG